MGPEFRDEAEVWDSETSRADVEANCFEVLVERRVPFGAPWRLALEDGALALGLDGHFELQADLVGVHLLDGSGQVSKDLGHERCDKRWSERCWWVFLPG